MENKVYHQVQSIRDACAAYLKAVDETGNECAWTDSKVEDILSKAKQLEEAYNSPGPADKVCIYTRDVNGEVMPHRFDGPDAWHEAYQFSLNQYESGSDDEILIVTVDGTMVYSGLSSNPLDWEDMTGFFA